MGFLVTFPNETKRNSKMCTIRRNPTHSFTNCRQSLSCTIEGTQFQFENTTYKHIDNTKEIRLCCIAVTRVLSFVYIYIYIYANRSGIGVYLCEWCVYNNKVKYTRTRNSKSKMLLLKISSTARTTQQRRTISNNRSTEWATDGASERTERVDRQFYEPTVCQSVGRMFEWCAIWEESKIVGIWTTVEWVVCLKHTADSVQPTIVLAMTTCFSIAWASPLYIV